MRRNCPKTECLIAARGRGWWIASALFAVPLAGCNDAGTAIGESPPTTVAASDSAETASSAPASARSAASETPPPETPVDTSDLCNVFSVELAQSLFPDAALQLASSGPVTCGWSNEDLSAGAGFGSVDTTCAEQQSTRAAGAADFRPSVDVGAGGCAFWLNPGGLSYSEVYWQQSDGTWYGFTIQYNHSAANRVDDAVALAGRLSQRLG